MKKVILILMFFLQLNAFSQERVLIKNEMPNTTARTELNVDKYKKRSNTLTSDRIVTERVGTSRPGYDYNRSLGAELMLTIPDYGYYSVEINHQLMVSPYGKFRFFDLPMGRNLLSIYEDGFLIYQANVFVRNNSFMNLEFQKVTGLYEVSNSVGGGHFYGGFQYMAISQIEYNEMIRYLNVNTTFDDARLQYISSMRINRGFTASQIAGLVRTLSFDKNKLSLAKEMYAQCVNPQMYHEVVASISYISNRRELEMFIKQQNTIRR